MKLKQGQIWKQAESTYRIVEWARPTIGYKLRETPDADEGEVIRVTKKEFCQLVKEAELLG